MDFKFFQKPKPIQPPGNMYLMFNMDDALINVIRWRQYHNNDMIRSGDTELSMVNVPVANCYMRILCWRNYTNINPEMIEIDYMVIEINTTPRNFTLRMETTELLRRIDITGI
jgi:hypothetical protein